MVNLEYVTSKVVVDINLCVIVCVSFGGDEEKGITYLGNSIEFFSLRNNQMLIKRMLSLSQQNFALYAATDKKSKNVKLVQ